MPETACYILSKNQSSFSLNNSWNFCFLANTCIQKNSVTEIPVNSGLSQFKASYLSYYWFIQLYLKIPTS